MCEQSERHQYLTGTSAGYTCLALALLAYLTETPFVKAGWIPARTPTAVVAVGTAILFLFPASLAYARMLARRPGAEGPVEEPLPQIVRGARDEPGRDPAPLSTRSVVTRTVILTAAVGVVIEVFVVGFEAIEYVAGRGAP